MRLRVFWLLLLLGCGPAYAGLFDDEEARRQITAQQALIDDLRKQEQALEARIAKLEEVLKNQTLLELHAQIEAIRLDLSKLYGQVEVLTNENELSQKRQKDFYVDLDNRLRRIEQPAPPAAAVSSVPAAAGPAADPEMGAPALPAATTSAPAAGPAAPDAAENQAYEAGYNLFKAGKYRNAITKFGSFLKSYPASVLAPSAVYWTGNSHYALREFKSAISTQQKLVSTYPDSPKVPDALLNIASSQQEMNNSAAARKTLEELIAKYPISDAAEKAKRRLAAIK